MGLLDRIRRTRRRSKFAKELADSFRPRLTRTKKEYAVLIHVGTLVAELEDALACCQALDAATRHWVARNIYWLVLGVPAGNEGYTRLYHLDMEKRRLNDERHVAAWVPWLLVLADHVTARAEGDGLCAQVLVVQMQARIETFLRTNGVPGWGVPITHTSDFNKLRDTREARQPPPSS